MDAAAPEREARIYAAAGLEGAQVDKWTANHVSWLASWDEHHVQGVVALLQNARRGGAQASRAGEPTANLARELREARGELGRALAQLNLDRGPRGYITDPTGRQELEMVVGWLARVYEVLDGVADDLPDQGAGGA